MIMIYFIIKIKCPHSFYQRWKAMKRHVAQLKIHCHPKELTCRQKQRQALLHWAYDSREM